MIVNVKEYMMFSKFFRYFFIITIITSCQLNAMECVQQEQKPLASDVQIYQFISSAAKNNPDFYLPSDLVHVITVKTHEIICYEKHGKCLKDVSSFLKFITKQAEAGIDSEFTTHILKICLDYDENSSYALYVINGTYQRALCLAIYTSFGSNMIVDRKFLEKYKNTNCYIVDVLCQIAGNDLINILYKKSTTGYMELTNQAFAMCARLVKSGKKANKETLESIDLLHWEHTPDYVQVILKYVKEQERAQLILDSHKLKYDVMIQKFQNGDDDSVD